MRKLSRAKLDRAIEVFRSHGAEEIYLFGSQATNRAGTASDVDIAVTGLAPKTFFAALGEAIDVLGRPIDLVNLDQDTPFTRYLKSEGGLVRVR